MTKHILSTSDKETLLNLYYSDIKFEEMYKITKIPRRQIRSFFKERELELVKRYNFNEKYFKSINTKEKAYWLGYLYCDGFVGEGKYNNIVLSSIDEHVIDKFLNDLEFDNKRSVKIVKELNEKRKSNSFAKSTLYESRFSSHNMKLDLKSRNIFPHRKSKSFIKYEDIDNSLWLYILFGFLDADSHISYNKDKNNRRIISLFSSKELIEDYRNFLDSLNIKYNLKYNKEKDCYYLILSFKDEYTSHIIESKFKKYSLMYRKFIAPSISKDIVE